ncbi:MAG: PaaI family thioesterase [Alphaproteobacteria bacterium]
MTNQAPQFEPPKFEPPKFEPKNPDYEVRVRDSFARQPFMEHIGASLEVVEPGYVEVHLPYRKELTQQHGFIHGGVLATLADNAAGYAAFTLMAADASVLTVEYKLNILRPGQGEKMIARGRVVKPGRSLTVVDSDVYARREGSEVMCVTSIQTLMALPGREDK